MARVKASCVPVLFPSQKATMHRRGDVGLPAVTSPGAPLPSTSSLPGGHATGVDSGHRPRTVTRGACPDQGPQAPHPRPQSLAFATCRDGCWRGIRGERRMVGHSGDEKRGMAKLSREVKTFWCTSLRASSRLPRPPPPVDGEVGMGRWSNAYAGERGRAIPPQRAEGCNEE
jgi:hypothetical protein